MFKDWLENSLLANVETSTKQVIHIFWSWLTQKQLSRVWLLNHLKWPVTDSWGQCRQGDSSTSHTDEWSHKNHDAHKQQGCWCVAPNQESALQEPADQMEDQTAEFPGVFRCFKSSRLHVSVWSVISTAVSPQEVFLPLLLLSLLIFISKLNPHVHYEGISTKELEEEEHSIKGLGYTPITNITSHIMEEVAQEMRELHVKNPLNSTWVRDQRQHLRTYIHT